MRTRSDSIATLQVNLPSGSTPACLPAGPGALPTIYVATLAGAPVALLTATDLTDYLPAMAVTAASSVALVSLAVIGLRRREE